MAIDVTAILDCVCLTSKPTTPHTTKTQHHHRKSTRQQAPIAAQTSDSPEEMATKVITTLRNAEEPGLTLVESLNDTVKPAGWSEKLAKRVLAILEETLKATGRDTWGPVLRDAYDKAVLISGEVFDKLVEEASAHPKLAAVVSTVLAIGVLAVLMPWVLELLGFAEEGPVAWSFAAWWQSRYGGRVPKGSLFTYLQRSGMVWGKGAPGGVVVLAKI
ncbi:putative HTH-type transcriptional regulator YdfL [Podospora aff. communis PSN243]|uniref:HTH-type transcriptional regulator YdfL n=1 Tax=Podospora aff. communis PSN243 TaxID=3040156 RepID=A0AAV9G8Y0_9PEZI|nr:putative HTH-type transcriptional regulator YdfL [Podospora aff. communis PSN243]